MQPDLLNRRTHLPSVLLWASTLALLARAAKGGGAHEIHAFMDGVALSSHMLRPLVNTLDGKLWYAIFTGGAVVS